MSCTAVASSQHVGCVYVCVCVNVWFKTRVWILEHCSPRKEAAGTEGWNKEEALTLQKDPFSSSGNPRGCVEKLCWTGPDPLQSFRENGCPLLQAVSHVDQKSADLSEKSAQHQAPEPPCGSMESWKEVPTKMEIEFSTSQIGQGFQLRPHLILKKIMRHSLHSHVNICKFTFITQKEHILESS